MLLTFIYSYDDIFRSVKQEASLYAERKTDTAGNSLFDELVFDEEYGILFRKHFFEAQAQVDTIVSAYLRDIPAGPEHFETQDFARDRDYILQLCMPDTFNAHMKRPVDIKIKQYLVDYFMYLWLRTKMPGDAEIYLFSASTLLPEIKSLLEKRTKNPRIKGRLF